jgi:hypothetical protein
VETFTSAKAFEQDSGFVQARQESLSALNLAAIDAPIRDIVDAFNRIPYGFTLQCCCGHLLWYPEQDPRSLEPVPAGFGGSVTYRIAYFAFCLENSEAGKALRDSLARLGVLAAGFIQFGSADWFWDRWPNSYVLQVMPDACMQQDEALLEPAGALHTRLARDLLFEELRQLVAAELRCH